MINSIINLMHTRYPYLKELGYGLQLPAVIFLQNELKKQNISSNILLTNLNNNSNLVYILDKNIENYRNGFKTNKTFSRFAKNRIIPGKSTKKIFHYVLEVNKVIYDPCSKMFDLPASYPMSFLVKNFNNINKITNKKYSMVDVDDMLSNRIGLITEIDNIIFQLR